MVTAQKIRYCKNKEEDLIIIENDQMRRQIVYLRKEFNTIFLILKSKEN